MQQQATIVGRGLQLCRPALGLYRQPGALPYRNDCDDGSGLTTNDTYGVDVCAAELQLIVMALRTVQHCRGHLVMMVTLLPERRVGIQLAYGRV